MRRRLAAILGLAHLAGLCLVTSVSAMEVVAAATPELSSRQAAEQLYDAWFRPVLTQAMAVAGEEKMREISNDACAERASAVHAEFQQRMFPALQAHLESPEMRAVALDIIAAQLSVQEAAHYLEQPWIQQADQGELAFIMTVGAPELSGTMLAVMNAPLLDDWGNQMAQAFEREVEQPVRALCNGEDAP